MSFGLTDEQMEQIVENMFWNPDNKPIPFEKGDRILNSPVLVHHIETNSDIKYGFTTQKNYSLGKNGAYLFSYYKSIMEACELSYKSQTIQNSIDRIYDYFKNCLKKIGIDTVSVVEYLPDDYHKLSGEFLLDGILKGLSKAIYEGQYKKPDFRDVVDDIIELMDIWEIQCGCSTGRRKFFSYVSKHYGLPISDYTCCPYCGEPLIKGIAYCPNCLENSKDFQKIDRLFNSRLSAIEEPNISRPEKQADSMRSRENEIAELKSYTLELESRLKNHIKEKRENNQTSSATIELYLATIKKLKVELAHKDKEIIELKHDAVNMVKRPRILVLANPSIATAEIKDIAKKLGLNPNALEIISKYSALDEYVEKVRKDTSYAGVIIGPAASVQIGNPKGYFLGNDFPYVTETRTFSGELKMTKPSLVRAFSNMYTHLENTGTLAGVAYELTSEEIADDINNKLPVLYNFKDKEPFSEIYADVSDAFRLMYKQGNSKAKENIVRVLSKDLLERLINEVFIVQTDLNAAGKVRDDIDKFGLWEYKSRLCDGLNGCGSYIKLINSCKNIREIADRMSGTHGNSINEKLINLCILHYYESTRSLEIYFNREGFDDHIARLMDLNRIRNKVSHDTEEKFTDEDYNYFVHNIFDVANRFLNTIKK